MDLRNPYLCNAFKKNVLLTFKSISQFKIGDEDENRGQSFFGENLGNKLNL